jgi:hypothetical protein
MPVVRDYKELVRYGWPTWPGRKEFNWGLMIGIVFFLLFWVSIIWFVFQLIFERNQIKFFKRV